MSATWNRVPTIHGIQGSGGGGWGRGGCNPDLKWQECAQDFFGFEIYDFGIFRVKKFWQVFSCVWVHLSRDFYWVFKAM